MRKKPRAFARGFLATRDPDARSRRSFLSPPRLLCRHRGASVSPRPLVVHSRQQLLRLRSLAFFARHRAFSLVAGSQHASDSPAISFDDAQRPRRHPDCLRSVRSAAADGVAEPSRGHRSADPTSEDSRADRPSLPSVRARCRARPFRASLESPASAQAHSPLQQSRADARLCGACCCRSDFVIAAPLSQVDHVSVVRIVKNANEVSLAQTFAVTTEQRARCCAHLRR